MAELQDLIAQDLIADVEKRFRITYNEAQKEAIIKALTHKLSIVTGGPGVGKTTVTKGILAAYKQLYPDRYIYLAAPTGRAAKRMTEVTGHEAKTIHRLLRYKPQYDCFEHDEINPLPGPGLLLLDEVSMCDILLARDLFRAIPDTLTTVLIGDVDQLPSVGPGSVLRDLIASGAVPTTRLTYVYRQAEGSGIALLADAVRQGKLPENWTRLPDVEVIQVEDRDRIPEIVRDKALEAVRQYGLMGVLVMAPMKKGVDGVANLNAMVREALNPAGEDKPAIRLSSGEYRLGDKVMVIKNNYHLGVFNGDLGIVREIVTGKERGILVEIDGLEEPVFFSDEDESADLLTLAYASTIHKAQGGEAPVAIVTLTKSHYIMLARNLFYTAITRAKKKLTIICQPDAVEMAVRNNKIATRNSRLRELLAAG
ncbi:AAA+ ATPase domain [Moorella glycerini]|uniref:ATP-dependent RecD-like DNA helicase n=1 Tax=Neomoorella stamsii TaxID=1266720 RepID=A0A9X7J034_9FIRM|nr:MULTISPECIES: AAA family ATPase [Moorella]PRR69620.1 ATP-dependent RecD-like DNA helicase [Moorella stamsii]CEP67856.1 AAA+ ATPase domain [Moorella glycerini]